MAKIGSIMTMGRQALMNNQTALQTVSHNIANKSTEGFSRQRVEFQTNDSVGFGKTRQGTGAHTSAVSRTNNPFLEKQIQTEGNKLGYSKGKSDGLSRVEQIFNETDSKGLNQFIGEFFNSFREFSNNPESQAARTLVKETAASASKDFGRISRQLKSLQHEVDLELTSQVELINSMSHEVADLNGKIQQVEASGGVANDERDRRDLLVKQIGEKINIRVGEGEDGMISITAGNTALLVSGLDSGDLKANASPAREGKRDGAYDLFFIGPNGEPTQVTQQISGGELGGMLEVRDKTVNEVRDKLDLMAYTISARVNEAHAAGFNKYNQSGLGFFRELDNVEEAAANIDLAAHIHEDVNTIAAAAAPSSPGDNRVAIVISSLQNEGIMDNGGASVSDYYNGLVGQLAVKTQKSNGIHEHQKGVVEHLKNVRESISGVSLDEEAIKMIEFQKAYDASAKMIKTADEMMQTVLDLKR